MMSPEEIGKLASEAAQIGYEAALAAHLKAPFTPAQEARLREIAREEIAAAHKPVHIDLRGAPLDPTILAIAKRPFHDGMS